MWPALLAAWPCRIGEERVLDSLRNRPSQHEGRSAAKPLLRIRASFVSSLCAALLLTLPLLPPHPSAPSPPITVSQSASLAFSSIFTSLSLKDLFSLSGFAICIANTHYRCGVYNPFPLFIVAHSTLRQHLERSHTDEFNQNKKTRCCPRSSPWLLPRRLSRDRRSPSATRPRRVCIYL